jgi:hypothetical protein
VYVPVAISHLSSATIVAAILAAACAGPTDVTGVAQVVVSPAAVDLGTGGQTALEAQVLDRAGHPLQGRSVYWSTEDSAVAAVSSAGVVVGNMAGRVRVAASVAGVSGTSTVTVVSVVIASVVITPAQVTVAPGATAQLQAAAFDPTGKPVSGLGTEWSGSNSEVATVNATGQVTGVGPGTMTVRAVIGSMSSEASVTVSAPSSGGGGSGGGSSGHHGRHGHHGH